MNRLRKYLIAIAYALMVGNAMLNVIDKNWAALMWVLFGMFAFYSMIQMQKSLFKCHDVINEQNDYIRVADEHIHFLTNHDTWKQIRQAKTEARISAVNCYHYLKRIGQLKAENEQLKILNRNLLHNQGKGVRNHGRGNRQSD